MAADVYSKEAADAFKSLWEGADGERFTDGAERVFPHVPIVLSRDEVKTGLEDGSLLELSEGVYLAKDSKKAPE